MDEVKIRSNFIKGLISRFIGDKIKKKTGYDMDIQLNEADIVIDDGKIKAHVDVKCDVDQNIVGELIK